MAYRAITAFLRHWITVIGPVGAGRQFVGEGVDQEQAAARLGLGVGRLLLGRAGDHLAPVVLDLEHDVGPLGVGPQRDAAGAAGVANRVGAQLRRHQDEVGGVALVERHLREPVGSSRLRASEMAAACGVNRYSNGASVGRAGSVGGTRRRSTRASESSWRTAPASARSTRARARLGAG